MLDFLAISLFGWFVLSGWVTAIILVAIALFCGWKDDGVITTGTLLLLAAIVGYNLWPGDVKTAATATKSLDWVAVGLWVVTYFVLGAVYIFFRYILKAYQAKDTLLEDHGISVAQYNTRSSAHLERVKDLETLREVNQIHPDRVHVTDVTSPLYDVIKKEMTILEAQHNAIFKEFSRKGIELQSTNFNNADKDPIILRLYSTGIDIRFQPRGFINWEVTYQYVYWPLDIIHEFLKEYLEKIVKFPLEVTKKALAYSLDSIIKT